MSDGLKARYHHLPPYTAKNEPSITIIVQCHLEKPFFLHSTYEKITAMKNADITNNP